MSVNCPITRGFHTFRSAQIAKLLPVLRWNRQHHPFLCLADPDLRVRQSGIFQRGLFQPDLGPRLFTHLAHGTREATGAAVGNRVIQFPVTRGEQHVHHHFLGDGIPDLYRAA